MKVLRVKIIILQNNLADKAIYYAVHKHLQKACQKCTFSFYKEETCLIHRRTHQFVWHSSCLYLSADVTSVQSMPSFSTPCSRYLDQLYLHHAWCCNNTTGRHPAAFISLSYAILRTEFQKYHLGITVSLKMLCFVQTILFSQ